MKLIEKRIKVKELYNGYTDLGDEGVFAFGGKLIVRPEYQREFIYDDKKRNKVIDTINKNLFLNTMYWAKNTDGTFEIIDGQQRTISICQYLAGEFLVDGKYYFNLTGDEKDKIDNFELFILECEGTEKEKLDWFRTINIAGEKLEPQELLNATYYGSWLTSAKRFFSKRTSPAKTFSDGYVKGNTIRQEYLEVALEWIADRDGLDGVEEYMALHQHDKDANDLWVYFQEVINWTKILFPTVRKGITDKQDWGKLYNKYHDKKYNINELEEDIKELLKDDDVTKKGGIIPYLLSDKLEEKHLSIRAFTDNMKVAKYEEQEGICPICGNHFEYEEMEGDHIIPWSKGGKTEMGNLQMLCVHCNHSKKDK